MSKPIVVIVCMVRSSESWEPQQRPHPWHRCAGGGAVHSINNGQNDRTALLVSVIVRDIDPDHPGDATEPVFQPLDYFSTDLIVLPKGYNPASGVGRLYVVGVH